VALAYNFHFAIIYTLVFAIFEFIQYITIIISMDGFLSNQYLAIRLLCIINHFIYLWIQIIGFKLYYKSGWKGYIIISFISACLLHTAWNGGLGYTVFLIILKAL